MTQRLLLVNFILMFLFVAAVGNTRDRQRASWVAFTLFFPAFFTFALLILFGSSLEIWVKAKTFQAGILEVRSVEIHRESRGIWYEAKGTIAGKPAVCDLTCVGLGPSKAELGTTYAPGARIPVFYRTEALGPHLHDPTALWAVTASEMETAPVLAKVGLVLATLLWAGGFYLGHIRFWSDRIITPNLPYLPSRPDRPQAWPLRLPFEPVLDLRKWALSGVAIGQFADEIRRLGRPSNARPKAHRRYAYHLSGTVVRTIRGRVDNLVVVLRPIPDEAGVEGAKGHLVGPNGGLLQLTDQTTLRHVVEFLGPPARKDKDAPDVDDPEIVYSYEYDGHGLDVEALPDGHVKCLSAYASDGE